MVDTIRALTLGPHSQTILGHPATHYLAPSLIWTAAILALFVPLAVARYRRG
jgi:hypothetical protein